MSNIYDLANQLERAVRELPEYKAVAESKKAVDADSEAKKILEDYMAFQGELQAMAQMGQMPTSEVQDKIQEFGEKIQANAALEEFFGNQQHLSVYLADIERIIFGPIQELMK